MDDSTSEVTVTENGSPEAQSSEEVTEVGTTNEENIIDESPQDDTASGDTTPEKTGGNLLDKLTSRVKGEFEIYVLIVIFGIWYLYNIGGALMGDEPVFALQGYYFFKGNMPAEQFRPMGRYFFGMGQLFFGRTTFGAKFFVFLLSMCTLYLTYNIGKKLANRHGGLLAAVFLGLIPLYGDLSVSAMMDVILTFFGALLFLFFLKYLRATDLIWKQRYLFLAGFFSISTFATKEYGVAFSLVVFLLLIHFEWKTVKTIGILKRRNRWKKYRKNLIFIPIFAVLGALFGLYIRAQLSDFWDSAGEKGKDDVLGMLPGFLDDIVLNMGGGKAHVFFIIVGILVFLIFWALFALAGRESMKVIRSLAKKRVLDQKFHVLIYLVGAVLGFVIIYSPYLVNPLNPFLQIFLVQTVNVQKGTTQEIAGRMYEVAPWWTYFYWIYLFLGITFVVGLLVSLGYLMLRIIQRDGIEKEHRLLLLYTFIPLLLLSALSLKNRNYFIIVFPFFSIFMVTLITRLITKVLEKSKKEPIENRRGILSAVVLVILLLLPGPVWMTLDDPSRGHDSGYDTAADMVTEYVYSQSNETIYVIAFDRYALEFHLSDEMWERVEIIPLFSDNYSKDALGHSFTFIPESVLYNMTVSGTIDLVLDSPKRIARSPNRIRDYVVANAQVEQINEDLAVYYLK